MCSYCFCICSSFFVIALCIWIHLSCARLYHNVFMHANFNGLLQYFQVFATMKITTVKIFLPFFWCKNSLEHIYLWADWLAYNLSIPSSCWIASNGVPKCLSKCALLMQRGNVNSCPTHFPIIVLLASYSLAVC